MWHEHDCHFVDAEVQSTQGDFIDWNILRALQSILIRPSRHGTILKSRACLCPLSLLDFNILTFSYAQESPSYIFELIDAHEVQEPKKLVHLMKASGRTRQASLAVLAHPYADCGLWRRAWVPTTNLDGEDLITVQGSDCGEAWQTLWTGHSTKTRHKTSHRHFTGGQTKQACT